MKDELEPSRRIRALVGDALASRGFLPPVAGTFSKVEVGVEIAELWCAPPPVEGEVRPLAGVKFDAMVALDLRVLAMPRGESWAQRRLVGKVAAAPNCAQAFRQLLDGMSRDVAAALSDATLRDRLLGTPPPPPDPPPPAQEAPAAPSPAATAP